MAAVIPLLKVAIRKEMKARLKHLSTDYINASSTAISTLLFSMPEYQNSNVISVYLSMGPEVNTELLVSDGFATQKGIYIPKILGKQSEDMFMLELTSIQQLSSFPRDKWNIPDPPSELIITELDGTYSGRISCVIMPGVAFDPQCGRVGHGKGYYDSFLARLTSENERRNLPPPITIALALEEQMLESVPMEAHDKYLDYVITPTKIYRRSSCIESIVNGAVPE